MLETNLSLKKIIRKDLHHEKQLCYFQRKFPVTNYNIKV